MTARTPTRRRKVLKPKPPRRTARFELCPPSSLEGRAEWAFVLIAANGEEVAAGEGYKSKSNAIRGVGDAIKAFRSAVHRPISVRK